MKFRWQISVVLLIVTGCTSQPQTPEATQSPPVVSLMASAEAPTTPVAQNNLPTIISVGDGDTARIRRGNETITVRLGCIDAPETAQTPWGEQSANRLKQLLPTGQAVQVREIERDRYGRTIAELYLGNQSVNLMMVKEGQAVVYQQYIDNCSETKDQYLQAEAEAKAQRLGFWNQPNPVMPWDFRRGKRSNNQQSRNGSPHPAPTTATNPSPVSTPTNTNCDSSYPGVCIPPAPPDLDCKDITYRNFRVLPSDPHRFDGRDNDGLGCES